MSNPMTAAESLGRSVDALIAERDALAAEVAALREDAERWRWVRERFTQLRVDTYRPPLSGMTTVQSITVNNGFSPPIPETVDAAIDAARAEAGSHD